MGGDEAARENAFRTLSIMGVSVTNPGNLNEVGAGILANGGVPPIAVFDQTTSTELARQQTKTTINVSTASVQRTSYGERVVDVQLARTMRSIPVRIQAGRLKPNTRYYVFFDEINVYA